MKRLILTLALIITCLGLNAQNVGSYIEVEHSHYILRYTVTSVSPAECAVANKQLLTESAIDVLPIPESIEINGKEFSVTTIANDAFAYCYSVRKFELPSTIKTIGERAFYYCNLATDIAIPEGVTYIGVSAFYGCSISEAVIPTGITSLPNGIFHRCFELREVEIPNTVTSIGRMSFGDCTSLTSIILPESINTIEDNAFSGCKNLALVKCYATNPPTCSNIFTGVPANIIIRVPAISLDLYKATDPWNKYDVRAIETEDLTEIETAFNIYPNPVENEIQISSEEMIEEVAIYNANGQQSADGIQQPTANICTINVEQLNPGIYFVKIRTNKNELVKKFIKK